MDERYILTPYFIDEPTPGLQHAAGPEWHIHNPDLPDGSKQERLAALYPGLTALVAETARAGGRPVSVAGDCVTSIAVLAGLQQAGIDPLLIWFDAHGDFNTWETTPSGFLGGMPLAMLTGRGEQTICEAVGLQPLPDNRVVLTDARDLDPAEAEALRASGIVHLSAVASLRTFAPVDRSIWVHFDTDVLRPEDAPAMNYPAQGGPSTQDLAAVFDHLSQNSCIAAVSVSGWNPTLDRGHQTEKTCISLLERLLGN